MGIQKLGAVKYYRRGYDSIEKGFIMKEEIKLNVFGSFPADVRYWPQEFPHKITKENKTPTLIIDNKQYQYDSGIHLAERSGATLRCLKPVIPDESLPRVVLKKVRVGFRSNQYSTAVAVTQFVRLYPQYGAAFGSFMGTATGHIEDLPVSDYLSNMSKNSDTGYNRNEYYNRYWIVFEISVLPYLGNDLAFLIEAKQLSTSEAESIATKIILEYQRIKTQFPDFLHGNITAFNIIVSENQQNIFFIDAQPGYAQVNNDLFQIVGICRKMMGGSLPETVIALLSPTEIPNLVLDNKKYQETKVADVKSWQPADLKTFQPKADWKVLRPKEFKFGARKRLIKLAFEVDKVMAAPWDDKSGNFSVDAFNIRAAVLKRVREKIDYLNKNAKNIQNWANITTLPIPEFETNSQVISFFNRYNNSIGAVLQEVTEEVTEMHINNKIAFNYGEFETLVSDLTTITSSPFFENFQPDFREKIALAFKKIGFIHRALNEEKKPNKNSSTSTQLTIPALSRWKFFLDNFLSVKEKKMEVVAEVEKVEDEKKETQFQVVPFASKLPFSVNAVIFNFLSWKHMLQLRETSHRFRSCIDMTPLPCTIIFLFHLQLILDLREAKGVQRLPPIVSQAILAAKCGQSPLERHQSSSVRHPIKDYVNFFSNYLYAPCSANYWLRPNIVNQVLKEAKTREEEAKNAKSGRLSLG